MRTLYLDCTSGISGDMTLGALLDLGIDKEYFINELKKLNVGGYQIVIRKIHKHGIEMIDVDVIIDSELLETEDHKEHHHHSNERNLADILKIIHHSDIAEEAKKISEKIFMEIAQAEAKVHGKPIEKVHFHEVGAIDSIVDIVGVAICISALKIDVIYSSPLHDGHGFIKCRHGIIPVPVPAVMAMLENSGIMVVQDDVETELITPTGMGIAKCLCTDFVAMPVMKIEKIGYGAGKRDTGKFGAVRAIIGTS